MPVEAPVTHYFAYGSNMNPARVAERALIVNRICGAILPDRSLVFNKAGGEPGAGHANIVTTPGRRVLGVLYELTFAAEIEKMDRFERAPWNYGRDAVWVTSNHRRVAAWTYFANASVQRDNLRPSRAYLDHLLAGEPYLTPTYTAWLRAHGTAD